MNYEHLIQQKRVKFQKCMYWGQSCFAKVQRCVLASFILYRLRFHYFFALITMESSGLCSKSNFFLKNRKAEKCSTCVWIPWILFSKYDKTRNIQSKDMYTKISMKQSKLWWTGKVVSFSQRFRSHEACKTRPLVREWSSQWLE